MSPRSGTFATACRTSLLMSPAMANDSPSLRLMFVNASFFRMTGIWKPADTSPWLKSRLDTSGRTRRLIVSPSSTTGRKMRPTPNSLNWIEMALFCCGHRVRELPTRDELRFLAALGDEVGLGERAEQVALGQGPHEPGVVSVPGREEEGRLLEREVGGRVLTAAEERAPSKPEWREEGVPREEPALEGLAEGAHADPELLERRRGSPRPRAPAA